MYSSLIDEASFILSQYTISVYHIINFKIDAGGSGKNDPETRQYFVKIKQQLIELLMTIADDIEILKDMLGHSMKLCGIIQNHSETIGKSSFLMNVLRERISRRPTATLRMENIDDDDDVMQLNQAFCEINKHESDCGAKLEAEESKTDIYTSLANFHGMFKIPCEEIETRKERIKSGIKELKQGSTALKVLATKGYSRKMQKGLDKLINNHKNRICAFRQEVLESRRNLALNN